MAKRNNIPVKVRNDYVAKQAYKLLNSMGVVSLPIDPFEILNQFGWKAYTIEEAEKNGVKCPFNLNENKPAINFRIPKTGERYVIYYDEKYIPRLRWSIAHEVGHIILGHKNEFPNRLTEAEYNIAEIEAHLFAAELLAPTRILASDLFPKTNDKIASFCNISPDAASKKLELFTGARQMNALSIMTKEGEELYRNMYNYVLDISNYWAVRLKQTDINLPQQYEDYVFCDYWDYTKSKMKREFKELYLNIDDSIAFYDNTNMILFVHNQNATQIDAPQKNIILDNISKYTNSSIRNIVSIIHVA